MGVCLGVTLRVYWVWFVFGLACTALGAALMFFALWWLGVDFGTIDWGRVSGAGLDPLTASMAFNVAFCFLAGLWLGFHVIGERVSAYVMAGVPGRRG